MLAQLARMSERPAFTPLEEAFFRAGETQEQTVDNFADLEEGGEPRRPFFRRLFSRKQNEQ
ncbi:MAG: hypothetical protein M4D80_00245 [Myxococcota bacterium]|nr:hypothetical protein [Deltaproteobacteria bacterium]MDQ3333583.1 hypothetical protein [Myxococcota bacterium]